MKIKLGGVQELSTVDWPGKATAVLFLHGCNFRCRFCFNADLVTGSSYTEVETEKIIEKLETFKPFVKSVVITGGEPTIQPTALIELCAALREKNWAIKLDTNGSAPAVVEKLIEKRLVDFIALDVKAPFEKYDVVTGPCDAAAVRKTFGLLLRAGVDYECRTPVVPGANAELLAELATDVISAKTFVLEQFSPERALDLSLRGVKGFSRDEMLGLAKLFKNPVVKIRTRECGEETI